MVWMFIAHVIHDISTTISPLYPPRTTTARLRYHIIDIRRHREQIKLAVTVRTNAASWKGIDSFQFSSVSLSPNPYVLPV